MCSLAVGMLIKEKRILKEKEFLGSGRLFPCTMYALGEPMRPISDPAREARRGEKSTIYLKALIKQCIFTHSGARSAPGNFGGHCPCTLPGAELIKEKTFFEKSLFIVFLGRRDVDKRKKNSERKKEFWKPGPFFSVRTYRREKLIIKGENFIMEHLVVVVLPPPLVVGIV